MTKRVFLSVDFDYFCREEDEWDWGHSENSDMFNEIAWMSRTRWYEETLLEKYANPHPVKFWDKLIELGFNFDDCESLSVANSHLWAAPDFLDLCPGEVTIVNFDAHHDMGYLSWKQLKKEWLDKGRIDCSNWLLVLMHQLQTLRAAVVYPEWKGLREIKGRPSWKNSKSIDARFQYGVYDEEFVRSLAGSVVGIFIAKSSAWMPPWHDEAFAEFVLEGSGMTGLESQVPFESKEGMNPLDVRPFDLEALLAHDRNVLSMFK